MFSGVCWPALCAAFEKKKYATFRAKGDICKLPLNTRYVYYKNTAEQ